MVCKINVKFIKIVKLGEDSVDIKLNDKTPKALSLTSVSRQGYNL